MKIDTEEQAGKMPSILTVQNWSKTRVSQKRFKHISGVAQTAIRLANFFKCDPYLAELAAWLHDACKENKPRDLVQQYRQFGLEPTAIEEANGHILHGPVAAELVKTSFGIKNEDVLNAIREHTLGAINMSLLSKIVFLADALEPSRPEEYTEPIWQALNLAGTTNIDLAILITLDLNLMYLLEQKKTIHPTTVAVRNHYLELVNEGKALLSEPL